MKKLRSRDYKALARERLTGRYGTVIGAMLLSGLITGLLAVFAVLIFFGAAGIMPMIYGDTGIITEAVAAIICALFIAAAVLSAVLFSMGMLKIHLSVARGAKTSAADVFYGFSRRSRPLRYLASILIMELILGLLLWLPDILDELIAPRIATAAGIMGLLLIDCILYVLFAAASLALSMVNMIRTDRPDTGVLAAFRESVSLMRGRKRRLLLVNLSFILWSIPIYLSLGIALLWIAPYMNVTAALFYLDASGELQGGSGEETKTDAGSRRPEAESACGNTEDACEASPERDDDKEDKGDEMPLL